MSSISLEDFRKVELRTARILEVSEIAGADKLWKLSVDLGSEKKEIIAGIKNAYPRETLLGKNVIVVNNLVPAVIRGVISNGMLLAAKDGQTLSILILDKDVTPGSVVA